MSDEAHTFGILALHFHGHFLSGPKNSCYTLLCLKAHSCQDKAETSAFHPIDAYIWDRFSGYVRGGFYVQRANTGRTHTVQYGNHIP